MSLDHEERRIDPNYTATAPGYYGPGAPACLFLTFEASKSITIWILLNSTSQYPASPGDCGDP
jgi:hypothetical protein